MSVTFTALDSTRLRKVGDHEWPEWVDVPGEEHGINLNNGNAAAVLRALGYEGEDTCYGKAPLPELRQRLLLALNRDVSPFVREQVIEYGSPRENEDGSIEMRPLRCWSGGLDEDGIRSRLLRLQKYIESASVLGATDISWG